MPERYDSLVEKDFQNRLELSIISPNIYDEILHQVIR